MTDLFGQSDTIQREASISECGQYRYSLSRVWDDSFRKPWAGWIMLNPSTADADIDDPTIRRCMAFSRAWGCGGMTVRNLFALRSTDPAQLKLHPDPIGPANDIWINTLIGGCKIVIAAWGVHGDLRGRDRDVYLRLCEFQQSLHCLGVTKDGHPKHPLYLARNVEPVPFYFAEPKP